MPTAPRTPRHSRNSSSAAASLGDSPQTQGRHGSSIHDAAAQYLGDLNHQDSLYFGAFSSHGEEAGQGMGNLADELADAASDSGEGGEEDYVAKGLLPLEAGAAVDGSSTALEAKDEITGLDRVSMADGARSKINLYPPLQNVRGSQRRGSEYDGSEYGSELDLDPAGFPPALVTKIDAIESLARRGLGNYGDPTDDVFKRMTERLRDLGSQSTVEGGATRLITAHSSLAAYLAHQARQLHNLTFPLLSPLSAPPDAETIDDLVPPLMSLSNDMPRPCTVAFNSLAALHSLTSELVQTLSCLSDSLHMSRQTTTTATRRLKSAKELVLEMRRDEELREKGERWLSTGNWGERLRKRECAGVCGEVIGGFEDVCNGWRQRLLAQAETQA